MQNDDNDNLPFSQRNGLAEIPPQLKIGIISDEFLHLLEYVIIEEINKNTKFTYPLGEAKFSKNLSDFSKTSMSGVTPTSEIDFPDGR